MCLFRRTRMLGRFGRHISESFRIAVLPACNLPECLSCRLHIAQQLRSAQASPSFNCDRTQYCWYQCNSSSASQLLMSACKVHCQCSTCFHYGIVWETMSSHGHTQCKAWQHTDCVHSLSSQALHPSQNHSTSTNHAAPALLA